MSLPPGSRLGPYEILAFIGGGGMGEVYRARDTTLRRDAAIKVLRTEQLSDPKTRSRLLREARAAASINHPNIATIYTVDESFGLPFIAMELVEGESVRALIASGSLTISRALDIGTQIAEGLCAAHRAGVIHRDLKPENVIVSTSGRVKILDFGIAKLNEARGEARGASQLDTHTETNANTIAGTTAYMSPEQVRGERVDARSDIFSFGSTFYEIVSGRLPFSGRSTVETLSAILTARPELLARFNPDVPSDLERVVARCLEKVPGNRFQCTEDLVAGLRAVRERLGAPSARAHREKLVVLPFTNLGPSEDGYFAAGITEEITSRLAVVSSLGVISRTTALQYDKGCKSIRQIGDELGVDFVLEGTVRWARGPGGASRVRITPQLIRVSDDTHVWADRYDRVMDDVFQIQSDIAENVTRQLGIVLLASEIRELRDRPTSNMGAYEAYLRGLYYERPRGFLEERDRLAVQMLEEAVRLDPDFALAHAELATTHSALYHYGFDHSANRLALATRAVEQAEHLAPQSPRVRLAMGYYYYWCRRDYERAFDELTVALQGMPGNSEVLAAMGFIRRREGRWEEALEHFYRACELNPMDTHFAVQVGDTLKALRRYSEAAAYFDQSIKFQPDQVAGHVAKAELCWASGGDTAAARAVLEAMPPTAANSSFGFIHWFWQEIFERNYGAALDRLSNVSHDVINPTTSRFLAAHVHLFLNERDRSHEAFEAARAGMESESRGNPDNYWLHAALGIVYAGLERKDEAIRKGRRAVELCPVSKDPFDAGVFVKNLALIHAMLGEVDTALNELERLVNARQVIASVEYLLLFPSTFSLPLLRMDPRWRMLWDHPRFRALVQSPLPAG